MGFYAYNPFLQYIFAFFCNSDFLDVYNRFAFESCIKIVQNNCSFLHVQTFSELWSVNNVLEEVIKFCSG